MAFVFTATAADALVELRVVLASRLLSWCVFFCQLVSF